MGGGGGSPTESPATIALRNSQITQLASIDAQDNYARKKILNASRGTRFFTGSPLTRAAPSNTAYQAPAPVAPLAPGRAAGGSAFGMFRGGAQGLF